MAISSDVSRNEYTGNGVATTFAITFNFFKSADLLVTRRNLDGTETTLVETTDYNVVGTNVVMVSAPANGIKIIILRDLDFVQTDEFRNQEFIYLDVVEDAFDKVVMLCQQLREKLLRSVTLPESLSSASFNPELPSVLPANSSVVVNPAGNGFVVGPTVSEISNAQSYALAADASADAAAASQADAAASAAAAAASAALLARSVTGTRAAPQNITAVGGIAFVGTAWFSTWFVQGSGGAVTVTANPRIAPGTNVGQELELVGRSDVNTVTLGDGNGLDLNGACVLGASSVLLLRWDGTNWYEVSRR